MSAYRSSLFRSLKKEVSEKLPQGSTPMRVWIRGVSGRLRTAGLCPGFDHLECLNPGWETSEPICSDLRIRVEA